MYCIIQVARNTKIHDSTSSEQIKYIRLTEIRLCIFFEIECVFVILNWKISLCVFSCDRASKELTVNGFEDILTVDGNIKRAKDIKNIDICDFWMWKYFQTNHMPLWNMKAYFFEDKIGSYSFTKPNFICTLISVILNIMKLFVIMPNKKFYCKIFQAFKNLTCI